MQWVTNNSANHIQAHEYATTVQASEENAGKLLLSDKTVKL